MWFEQLPQPVFVCLFVCFCCCRLSGTGSAGATIRMYIEQYTDDKARLKEDAQVALKDIIKVRASLLVCYVTSRCTVVCLSMYGGQKYHTTDSWHSRTLMSCKIVVSVMSQPGARLAFWTSGAGRTIVL
jgi:hypothetical protein